MNDLASNSEISRVPSFDHKQKRTHNRVCCTKIDLEVYLFQRNPYNNFFLYRVYLSKFKISPFVSTILNFSPFRSQSHPLIFQKPLKEQIIGFEKWVLLEYSVRPDTTEGSRSVTVYSIESTTMKLVDILPAIMAASFHTFQVARVFPE